MYSDDVDEMLFIQKRYKSSPMQQLEQLALKRVRKILKQRGVSREDIVITVKKIPIKSLVLDIGFQAGINLVSIWWCDTYTQSKYIETHRLTPTKIVRRGCTYALVKRYMKQPVIQPKDYLY